MKKLLKKIYDAVIPVSRKEFSLRMSELQKEFGLGMSKTIDVIDGLLIANTQQAEMVTSLITQLAGLQMKKAETKEKEEVEYDVSVQ